MEESRTVFGVEVPQSHRKDSASGRVYAFDGVDADFSSVTTILDSIPNPVLKRWLAKQYMNEIRRFFNTPRSYDEILTRVNVLFRKASDGDSPDNSAAEFGTAVHELCEQYIIYDKSDNERDIELFIWDDQYDKCMNAFVRWYKQVKDVFDWETEVPIYSEKHQYAGTADLVMRKKATGDLLIGDIKTSKRLYANYDYQIAAYAKAFEEMGYDGKVYGGFLLHLDKMYGYYDERLLNAKQLDDAFDVFASVNKSRVKHKVYEDAFNASKQ